MPRHRWKSLEPAERFASVCIRCGCWRKVEPNFAGGWKMQFRMPDGSRPYPTPPCPGDAKNVIAPRRFRRAGAKGD